MRTLFAPWLMLLTLAATATAESPERPNVLWLVSEDNGISWVSSYGGVNAQTPVIDGLAREGFRYTHAFSNAAVCAPSRSTWITGMYAISNGTQPMRSRYAIPHDRIRYYPDLLREAGYFTANPGKTDYNIGGRDDGDCWDYAGGRPAEQYSWRKAPAGKPFFSVINFGSSHESQAFGDIDNTQNDPAAMRLHAYHPDLITIRKSYAKYADAVERMDRQLGQAIEALKADGLYEDTIIFYCSDHAGVMPRSKRFLYSSGVHCPLVVRIPEKFKHLWPAEAPGATIDRIVSFVDMPKTYLSLAGAEIPDTYQGTIFLGPDTEPEPQYHLSFRARADDRLDSVRMIRDKRYAYYKNYMPFAPAGQYLQYLWRIAATPAWEEHHRAGHTDEITGRFFRPRVSEEFYDTVADFDNVHNLIDDPEHQAKIAEMRQALRAKQLELYDSGLLPESMMARRAAQHRLTIYDMVRNSEIYPLATYLDTADFALERDPAHLPKLVEHLQHADEAFRYWATVGLHLLDGEAQPAAEALTKALDDDAPEVRIMAAWTLVRLGHREPGLARLRAELGDPKRRDRLVINVLDWMGPEAMPLIQEFAASNPNDLHDILARALRMHGTTPGQP